MVNGDAEVLGIKILKYYINFPFLTEILKIDVIIVILILSLLTSNSSQTATDDGSGLNVLNRTNKL